MKPILNIFVFFWIIFFIYRFQRCHDTDNIAQMHPIRFGIMTDHISSQVRKVIEFQSWYSRTQIDKIPSSKGDDQKCSGFDRF